MIAQELSISFWDSTGPDIIIHQGEKGREIEFIPDVELPDGAAAQLVIVKPDKTFTISDCTINNHDHIIAEIPEQAGAVIGLAHYIIKITDTDTLVYSASGGLWVDDALLTDAMIESVAEVNGYVFPDDFLTAADLADYVTDSELETALQPYALTADLPVIAANPSGAATGTLEKLRINNDIFAIPDPIDVYSTTEHIVGRWTDGATIYERTFNFTMPKSSSWQSYNHGISNLDKVVDVHAFFTASGTNYPLPQYRDNSNAIIICAGQTTIEWVNTWIDNAEATCTLRYTKRVTNN